MERKRYFQVSRRDYKVLFREYRIYLKYKAMEKRIGDGNNVMSKIAAENIIDYCAFAKIDFVSVMYHIIRLRLHKDGFCVIGNPEKECDDYAYYHATYKEGTNE